jgi:hypothetical protein
MRTLLLTLGVLFALATPATAQAPLPTTETDDQVFAAASKSYAARDYEGAITRYEQLIARGVRHEDIFYNLANAYFRSAQTGNQDRVGRAILNYERALQLSPSFEDARYNLEVARELVAVRYGADKVKDAARDPLWIRIVTWLPLSTLAWSFLALDLLFFLILVLVRFLPTGFLRTGLVVGNVFCGVAGLVLGGLLLGHVIFLETVKMGVVISDEVVVREGPAVTWREYHKLHAGHRAAVLREEQGWLRIRLANQSEGWVPRESVEEI